MKENKLIELSFELAKTIVSVADNIKTPKFHRKTNSDMDLLG